MKVFIKGQGSVSLNKSNFVASGGEGEIYCKGNTAFKIYINPKQMIPVGKIQELSVIKDPNVNKPEQVVINSKGSPIGYTTRFIKNAVPLCSMFPKVFRNRNNITPDKTIKLVQRLREMVQSVHSSNILIVDLNEMNFLINNSNFSKIYGIDVDSYQTPHFKATALMESVRDRHSGKNVFNKGTDWFAFAITSFQMFRGIHPYKGKHSSIKGLDARMKANISVLHPDVRTPKAVLPVDVIPQSYIDWYNAVLHDGKRVPPPITMQDVIVIAPTLRVLNSSGNINIDNVYTLREYINNIFFSHGSRVSITKDKSNSIIYINERPALRLPINKYTIGFTKRNNDPVVAYIDNNHLQLKDVSLNKDIPIQIKAENVVQHNGRFLVKNNDHIYEINMIKAGGSIIATPIIVGNVLPKASKLYSGVAIQNMLGTPFISIFPRERACYQLKIDELKNYKIIDAKFDNNVLMVIGVKKNKYDRLVFRFNDNFTTYDIRKVEDIIHTGLNFITLDTGICVCLNEEDKIEAFSSKIGASKIKMIEDSALDADIRLFKMGGKVGFFRGNSIHSMSMR